MDSVVASSSVFATQALPHGTPPSANDQGHIALVGPSGVGKSSAGRQLAESLGLTFIDLDDTIAARARKSCAQIFREGGEVAFRAQERAALREILQSHDPMVIATGGGTYVDPKMQALLELHSRPILLHARTETLVERLKTAPSHTDRPMLDGPDLVRAVERLQQTRQTSYDRCTLRVETDALSLGEVVSELIKLTDSAALGWARARRSQQPDKAGRQSPGTAEAPLLTLTTPLGKTVIYARELAGNWLAEATLAEAQGRRIAIITDHHVEALHAESLRLSLEGMGAHVSVHSFQAGEESKSLKTAETLYDSLGEAGLTRQDTVIGLGGGVCLDIAGFVASTYLRGIAFLQIPTSTLGAIDACLGGKTGLNTRTAKNMIGTFAVPRAVLIAASHLTTQDRRRHAAGLVEALKMAATFDAALFSDMINQAQQLLTLAPGPLLNILTRSLKIKAAVVQRDFFEQNDRALLNYGHTVGHAIEMGENYRVLHGEAVGLGMIAEAAFAESLGLGHTTVHELTQALATFGMPHQWRRAKISPEAMARDKKRRGDEVMLPIVKELGSSTLHQVSLAALQHFVKTESTL